MDIASSDLKSPNLESSGQSQLECAELIWSALPRELPTTPPAGLTESAQWTRLTRVPTMGENYRAVLSRRKANLKRGEVLPHIGVESTLRLDAQWLERYHDVCELEPNETNAVPITVPQVIAAPLQTYLLAARALPVRVLGVVHAANEILGERVITPQMTLKVSVWVGETRWKPRGFEFDLHTVVAEEGQERETLWRARTVIFRSVRESDPPPRGPRSLELTLEDTPHHQVDVLKLSANQGRRYAPIAADYNPIHLYPVTARLFGFKRPIVHGMWTLARLLSAAQAQGQLDALSLGALSVRFKKPLALPSQATCVIASHNDQPQDHSVGSICAQVLDERGRVAVEVAFSARALSEVESRPDQAV